MDMQGGTWQRQAIAFAVASLVIFIFLVQAFRITKISGDEVGIMVNNWTGEVEVIEQPGSVIYNGLYKDLHRLDKRLQTLEMHGEDRLRVKTKEGSDVELDMTVQYQMISARAKEVAQWSGLGGEYKEKWLRDYARSFCRTTFGTLNNEEFYNASMRTKAALVAQEQLNQALNPRGITVTSVMPSDFRFYKEYDAKIREKKHADQEVQTQRSKAEAADQEKKRGINKATLAVENEIVAFKGRLQQLILNVEGERAKALQEAQAYAVRVTKEAQARLYQIERQAEGVLARREAEAKGILEMRKALEGEGGRNLVKLEYARRLKEMTIRGKPYVFGAEIKKFEHSQPADAPGAAAAAGGK